MSINLSKETKEINKEDRTWRVEIFCEHNQPYQVVVHRETLTTDADGNTISSERGVTISRTLEELSKDSAAVQIAAGIKSMADKWRQEDIDNSSIETPIT